MRTLFGTILAAVAAFNAVAGIDCADVSVADFPRLAGETGDSARIMRAVESVGKGGVVWFPRGEYEIDALRFGEGLGRTRLARQLYAKVFPIGNGRAFREAGQCRKFRRRRFAQPRW